jgi:glycosyltransferase involved in cell wall biosynthesis
VTGTKKKILFVHYSDVEMTGGERMTLQLLKGMLETEYTPVLLTQRSTPLAEAAQANGIATRIVPLPTLLDRYDGEILQYSIVQKCRSAVQLLSYNRVVAKLLRQEHISAVWCSNVRALLTVGFTARVLHIPLVWNIWLARQFGRWTQEIYNLCYYLPNHIVTEYRSQGRVVFRRLDANGRLANVSTVYTGIDASFFEASQPKTIVHVPSVRGGCHILSCCRITPRKDIGCLLETMAILARRRRHNIHLTIAGKPFSDGDRSYYQKLLEKIARDGIGSMVRFTDWHDEVRPLMETADIFISTSLSEGLPGAVREAQAVGLPVIATDAGGTREAVLDGSTGLIVPCHDAQALADAIERLADDPLLARSFGNAGRERAAELFSTQRFIQAYSDVFRRVMSVRQVGVA